MLTQFEQSLISRAKKLTKKPRILFPETLDSRILQAIARIIKEDIAIPAVMESPKRIQSRYPQIQGEQLYDVSGDLKDEKDFEFPYLNQSADLLNEGKVDGVIVGAITPSAQVFRTALSKIGKASKCNTISGAMFIIPEKTLDEKEAVYLFADVAVTIEPSQQQLVEISLSSADTWKRITQTEPRVALLSFSTLGSATHSSIDPIKNAVNEIKRMNSEIDIFGEIQFDAAIDPDIALTKGISIHKAGANVFIFPNLVSANIGYKIAQKIGKAKTIAFTQGLKRPFFDLSRGSTVDEVVTTCALLTIYASQSEKGVEIIENNKNC